MRRRPRALLPSLLLVALAVPAGLAVAQGDGASSTLTPAAECPEAKAYIESNLDTNVASFAGGCPDLAEVKSQVDATVKRRVELVREFAPDCREALAQGADNPTCVEFLEEARQLNDAGGE